MRNQPSRTQVGIPIFDDVEVLDFCGPFEVFSVASALGEVDDAFHLYSVHVIAETLDVILCRNGLSVQPQATIDDHPRLDIVVVPEVVARDESARTTGSCHGCATRQQPRTR
jgi:putative intracellular protease/amidase